MNFPVEVTKRQAGMHGMATVTNYHMGEEVKEAATPIPQRAEAQLAQLAIQVAEKQLPKPQEAFNTRFGEIKRFISEKNSWARGLSGRRKPTTPCEGG